MPDLRAQSPKEQQLEPAFPPRSHATARINARWRSKFLQNFGFLLTAIVRDFFDVEKLDCDSSEVYERAGVCRARSHRLRLSCAAAQPLSGHGGLSIGWPGPIVVMMVF
jgi:hypothetical protein